MLLHTNTNVTLLWGACKTNNGGAYSQLRRSVDAGRTWTPPETVPFEGQAVYSTSTSTIVATLGAPKQEAVLVV